jgi:hypothetical protein
MVRWALHSLTGRVAKTAGPLPDVSAYDAFVVATPVWAFKPAPPVAAFLQAIDFAGKPVVPLATCGSNARDFLGAFERQLGRHGHMIRKRAFSVVGGQSDSALAEALNRWAVNF